MDIDNLPQAFELKLLLEAFMQSDEEAKSWASKHLDEFWQALEAPCADFCYQAMYIRDNLCDPDGCIFRMSFSKDSQVCLWRYDRQTEEWIIVDKNHSPEDFFRRLKLVLLDKLEGRERKLLCDGAFKSPFGEILQAIS